MSYSREEVKAITDKILTLAKATPSPAFIYAVTIENHGPWSTAQGNKPDQLVRNYNQLVRAGDTMLTRMLRPPYATASDLVSESRPVLLT